ncbi:hypothetical protein F7D95_04860 [Prevotella copri]|jgi:hypothetical protein|uniref:Uncharacterized protein n=1 Tax=Segatella copri TaxID=165179 RepID=A0AA90UE99_9BACT|nr:NVEALA domain-containing protein [Prevotella sp. AM23-5]MQN12162.1 hypothetical protein [Segatella copri]RHN90599.1 hypothetical protein DW657_12345 [Prevotella sp. AM23-5]
MNKKLLGVACLAIACAGGLVFSSQIFATPSNDVMMQNVEALSDSEGSGAKCPKGCRSIGWGTDKILECDCNYDHFSCCNLWGC